MPRISADSIAEHVARQQTAVFEAAIRLFLERGFEAVTLGDIAAEVGLARSSLYRYYPDKAHILLEWLRQELPEQERLAREVLTADETATARLQLWAGLQMDYARRPEHGLVAALGQLAPQLDDADRDELADSHRRLAEPLLDALADAGVPAAGRPAAAELLSGLVLLAARIEARHPGDPSPRRVVASTIDTLAGGR